MWEQAKWENLITTKDEWRHLGKQRSKKEGAMAKKKGGAHADMWAPSFYLSMSPSMSSTSWEQQRWEVLGGAAERVTRSVSGRKASHCVNKGNACCHHLVLSHQAHRESATTPPLSSRATCHFALPSLTLPPSWQHHASCLAYVGLPIRLRCCSHHPRRHDQQHSPPPLYEDVDLQKSMHVTPNMCCTRCERLADCINLRKMKS